VETYRIRRRYTMRILNENNVEIESPDLNLGYLKNDRIFVKHHDHVATVEEKGHYETVRTYPNGGKDVEWVVDVPGVEACDAWDEYETILRYILYTEDELAAMEAERGAQEDLTPVTWADLDAAYQEGVDSV
jgi:hypothetical protein